MDDATEAQPASLPTPSAVVTRAEIVPGLVLHLDPDELERSGGTYSCAKPFRVQGGHFFVCLSVSDQEARWLPLYTNDGPGRTLLTGSRSGHSKWTGATTYYHSGQIWTADHAAIAAAALAGRDLSTPGARNMLSRDDIPAI